MRAGPLSDHKVIALLNAYYVPVYTSNEDYEAKSTAVSAEEKAEKQRIFVEFAEAHMGTGDVHVYILKPDGHALGGLDIGSALDVKKLTSLLEKSAAALDTPRGDPVIAPKVTSVAPPHGADDLALHLISRGDHTGTPHWSWREFPAENWFILELAEWSKLLPPKDLPIAPGAAWELDKEVMAIPLHRFYPQTEETTDDARTQIERQSVRAKVLSVEAGVATARLDGMVALRRTNTNGKPDPNLIEATLVGSIQWEGATAKGPARIRLLQLVTASAHHGAEPFEVAVKSVK